MKTVQTLLPVFGLLAAAQASYMPRGFSNDTVVYETVTVKEYTTYCPEATTLTHGTKTYTATAKQTLTITDCPCTLTKPAPKPTPTPAPTGVTLPPPIVANGTTIPPVYVTATLTAYTTYCPLPTTFVVPGANSTITVSTATTLTISKCPGGCVVSYPATTYSTVSTISYYTTYCPVSSTTLVYGPTYPVTVPVSTPGTYTIPVVSCTPVAASPPTPTAVVPATTTPAVVGGGSAPGTGKPVTPSATPTGPIQASSGEKTAAGFGAVVFAAFAALVL